MKLDSNGHLIEAETWTHAVAAQLAAKDSILLEHDHLIIITAYRDFVMTEKRSPTQRQLMPYLIEYWPDSLDAAIRIHQLFPQGAKQIAKFAGLPLPKRCL